MATGGPNPGQVDPEQMTEEQLRAAYEAEIKRVRVEHVLLENVVTLINLGMRRTGLVPGTEDEADPAQVSLAVDSVRALLPMVEQVSPEQAAAIRDALSQLQMAFVQAGSGAGTVGGGDPGSDGGQPGGSGQPGEAGAEPDSSDPVTPGEPGPAQRSGRLWVPGQ
jgi:hypothetical protein